MMKNSIKTAGVFVLLTTALGLMWIIQMMHPGGLCMECGEKDVQKDDVCPNCLSHQI